MTHAQLAAPTSVPADSRGLPTLAPMLRQVSPGVVNISVVQRPQGQENPMLRDPFWRRFFDTPERQPQQSAGSGVIVDAARGLVLTNHHVIDNAREIVITLKDRRQLKAQVVGSDPATDIALLRIPAENLTAVRFGDSDELQVGDFAVAIGNPFGLGQTVTSGIISALGRTGLGIEGYEDFIQTDASINPGNSGGALVNLRGELIGINTAILAPAGGNVGIGFAVPTMMVRAVMDQLLRFGEVRRGRLGVSSADLSPDAARELRINVTEGAVLAQVEPGSAAEKAGLRPKDIVIAANGRPVRGASDLRNRIGLTPTGEEIVMTVLRAGQTLTIRARIAEIVAVAIPGSTLPQLAGARVATLERNTPGYGSLEGALVASVERDSAAYNNGLRSGDVIFGLGRRRIRNVEELIASLKTAERPWRMTILRGDARLDLVVR